MNYSSVQMFTKYKFVYANKKIFSQYKAVYLLRYRTYQFNILFFYHFILQFILKLYYNIINPEGEGERFHQVLCHNL